MGEIVLQEGTWGRFIHYSNLGLPRLIILCYCVFFTLLGSWQLMGGSIKAFDNFLAAVILGLAFFASKWFVVRPFTAFLGGLIFIPNVLGQMGMYWTPIFNYHGDWVVHSVAAFCFTIVSILFLLDNKLSKSFTRAALLALLATGALGALIEITEYWGFRVVGYDEGYLGFGDGDNSSDFGPWENSSLDTTFNFLGSIAGILLSLAIVKFSREKQFTSSQSLL